jgi:hypothetical protein
MSEPVFLLLARAADPAVETLRQLQPRLLRHVDIADLSSAGWRYVVGHPEQATACAGGEVLAAGEIAAVLCRIVAVVPEDLEHLHSEDRAFAAAEMNAFLRAWLAQFAGRKCNEPNGTSLAGPAWHAMRWRWLAQRLGVPAVAASFGSSDETSCDIDARSDAEGVTVIVIGDQVIGRTAPTLERYSLRIAREVHSSLLALRFVWDREWRFESADACPHLNPRRAAKLLEWAFAAPARHSKDLRTASAALR